MQIDSTRIHEFLNRVAIECENKTLSDTVQCVKFIRAALIDLEVETACRNAEAKYADALKGLADK